jgi:hypothetical protein
LFEGVANPLYSSRLTHSSGEASNKPHRKKPPNILKLPMNPQALIAAVPVQRPFI